MGIPVRMSDRTEWRLSTSLAAPRQARDLVSAAVRARIERQHLSSLLLVVTELVSNAVRHGKPEADGRIGLRLEIEPRVVRIVATDAGTAFEPPRRGTPVNEPHFGLFLVDALAQRWGVAVDGQKGVWAELDL